MNIPEAVARLRRRAVIELSAEASVSRVNTPPRPNQTQHRRKGTDGRDDTDEGSLHRLHLGELTLHVP